jgi:hyperosmotically inducible periplasmic protein
MILYAAKVMHLAINTGGVSMINRTFFRTIAIGVGVAALSFTGSSITQARALQQPDNTSTNKQQAPTADQQKETAEDRELAQKIRKSIVDDKSLSTYGHNVKVIVRNGMVTLKGPVQSEDEKKNIGAKAADVAGGAAKVQNDLTVKS